MSAHRRGPAVASGERQPALLEQSHPASRFWVAGYPELVAEWHPTRNGRLTPDVVSYGSGVSVWWKCPRGPDHEWRVSPNRRTSLRQGCPFCAGRRVSVTNSLATVYPEFAAEWHPTKNGDLRPEHVVVGSTRRVFWKCRRGEDHEWATTVHDRQGCPFCRGLRTASSRSLSRVAPKIAAEWHPTKNGDTGPDDVTAGSSRRAWWRCGANAGHEWCAQVQARLRHQSGCPFCSGRRHSAEKSLARLRPDLVNEWHPTKNLPLTPLDVTPGGTLSVHWICANRHEWCQPVRARAGPRKRGCPECRTGVPADDPGAHRPLAAREPSPRSQARRVVRDTGAEAMAPTTKPKRTVPAVPTAPGASPRLVASQGTILLLEDDEGYATLLERVLRSAGYETTVLVRADALPARSALASYDAVLTDVRLADGTSGHDVLRAVRESGLSIPVVLMTAFPDSDGAMRAVRQGAYDYITKPVGAARLLSVLREAIARSSAFASGFDAAASSSTASADDVTVNACSRRMLAVYKTVAQVAPTDVAVLLVGESGTGKELMARTIHARSARKDQPFVAVHGAALSETLLESELFGYERGSFSGAPAAKRGLFELADGGTLFLDEIDDVSPKMQVQLLRVLQEGEIRRIGGVASIAVNVRVIAATHRDLAVELRGGRFRPDLFFRLQGVTLTLAALRDRREDILPLSLHFLFRHAQRLARPTPRLSREAVTLLEGYAFPGNVRELSHIVERALLVSRSGVVTAADLPPEVVGPPGPVAPELEAEAPAAIAPFVACEDWPTLEQFQLRYIERVLARTAGNKTQASALLGIDRRTLSRTIERHRTAGRDGSGAEAAERESR